ncbi:MAG: chemotaxis protein CheA [Nitrospinae bacterium]|nr:chemotaxis protein CheA [Nitrospinota bacterium]
MKAQDSNDDLFNEFLEESEEMVAMVERNSSALGANPEDITPVHEIFRGVHSLKGSSNFFNLGNLKEFTHNFESFLDLIREKTILVTPEITHFILDGADLLKAIFHRLRSSGGDVPLLEEEAEYLKKIEEQIGACSSETRYERLRIELLKFFNKAAEEGSMEEDSPLKEVYEIINHTTPELVEDRRKKSATAGGSRWTRGDLEVTREYSTLQSLFQDAASGASVDNAYKTFMENVDSLVALHKNASDEEAAAILENMKENFGIFFQDEIGLDEMLAADMSESLTEYGKLLSEVRVEEKKAEPAGEKPEAGETKERERSAAKAKTVRIRESLLDDFIDQVGELITTNELFNIIQKKLEGGELEGIAKEMKNTNQAFRELSAVMQKSLYEIRKAPVERALGKLPSIVRGIAKGNGKSVQLVMSGGETELDKSMLDRLEMMLIHCVRNSADHGIETPEERAAAGKPPEGKIMISVAPDEQGSNILLTVADDGKGVDVARVKRKAVEKGMITVEAAALLPEDEALSLLLKPGFSTAEKVTETSGRGVGMDVLWAGVHGMGGQMKMHNSPGKGLRIEISLPLAYTTRIKLGLMLGVGDNVFLVPVENVRESFRAVKEDVTLVEGKGEVVKRWGMLYPVVRLGELFGVPAKKRNIWDSICVLAESKGIMVVLAVDDMLGQRQIVYKQLTVQTREPAAFEGISILDGRHMALILSVEGIIRQFQG